MSHQVAVVPARQDHKSFDGTGAIVAGWMMECAHRGQRFGIARVYIWPALA
jgi:hypothetical protein